MEQITLGQLKDIAVFLVAMGGAFFSIWMFLQKGMKKVLEPTNKKIDELGRKIDKVDKNATMNFIVSCFNTIETGTKLDGVSMMRLKEQYEHYIKDLNGNTYIHDEYEKFKKEGKL